MLLEVTKFIMKHFSRLLLSCVLLLGGWFSLQAEERIEIDRGIPTPGFIAASSDFPTDVKLWHEVHWSKYLADTMKGEAEARMVDQSRVDILTDDIAWEVEWIDKWQEGIGQAIQYHVCTGRDPGLLILVRGEQASVKAEYNRILAAVTNLRAHGYDFNLRFQETK